MSERKKIAAIATAYYPFSHADVIISKFLKGFPADGELLAPDVDIVSMYMDQRSERDVGVQLAREHGVEIYFSISSALCLGGSELAVDGVLIIGEHGDYAWIEHPPETPIADALSVAYGGLDSYGFHALETLQCMVERRRGGETGIVAVQCLEGPAVWDARDRGRWSGALAEAALENVEAVGTGDLEELCAEPAVFLIEYADGLKAATLMANGFKGGMQGWGYAAMVAGKQQACEFYLHGDPHPHFSYLSLNIQKMFLTGRPQYPVERTLLVSGVLEALLDSRYRGHVRLETPHLGLAYASYDAPPIRPEAERPSGAATEPWRPE